MRRRDLIKAIGYAVAASPLEAYAQQAKAARVGYLSPASNPDLQKALLGGLRDLGYVEGQNLAKSSPISSRRSLNLERTLRHL